MPRMNQYTWTARVFGAAVFQTRPARKCRREFLCQFPGQPLPSKQSIHNLVNKLKTTQSLLEKSHTRDKLYWQKRNWMILVINLKLHQEIS